MRKGDIWLEVASKKKKKSKKNVLIETNTRPKM